MVFPRAAAPILCSASRVSEATLGTFFGAILGLVRPSGPWCFPIRQHRFSVLFPLFWWDSRTSSSFRAMVFPRPAAPIFCSVSRVSEATLGTFLVGFSD